MHRTYSSVAFAVILGSASIAQAEPGRFGLLEAAGAGASIILAGGCHDDEETHYVPEVNRRMAHVHIGDDCEPYKLSDSTADDDDYDEADVQDEDEEEDDE